MEILTTQGDHPHMQGTRSPAGVVFSSLWYSHSASEAQAKLPWRRYTRLSGRRRKVIRLAFLTVIRRFILDVAGCARDSAGEPCEQSLNQAWPYVITQKSFGHCVSRCCLRQPCFRGAPAARFKDFRVNWETSVPPAVLPSRAVAYVARSGSTLEMAVPRRFVSVKQFDKKLRKRVQTFRSHVADGREP